MFYRHTCRICFDNNAKYDNVVLTSGSKWANLFEFCVGTTLELGRNPLESCVFCKSCGDKLRNFSEFKKKCLKSDDVWKQMCVEENKKNAEKIEIKIDLKREDDMKTAFSFEGNDFDYGADETITSPETQQEAMRDLDHNIGNTDTDVPLLLPAVTGNAMSYQQEQSPVNIGNSSENNLPKKNSKPTTTLVVVLEKRQKAKRALKKAAIDNLEKMSIVIPKSDKDVTKQKVLENELQNSRDYDHSRLPLASFLFCGICSYKSKDSRAVRAHWKKHVAKNELHCEQCQYVGRDMADMAAHRFKHYPPEFLHQKQCLLCYKFMCTKSDKYIEYHYRSEHLNVEGGWCTVCDKKFDNYDSYVEHDAAHDIKYTCNHCGRDFTYHALKVHMSLRQKTFICDQCGKGFANNSVLNEHIIMKHTTESLNLKCDQCAKVYRTKVQLKRHQYKHKTETHVCNVCGATFARKENLKSHHKTHVDDKPYACDICGKAFKWLCNMKAHVARHQREPKT